MATAEAAAGEAPVEQPYPVAAAPAKKRGRKSELQALATALPTASVDEPKRERKQAIDVYKVEAKKQVEVAPLPQVRSKHGAASRLHGGAEADDAGALHACRARGPRSAISPTVSDAPLQRRACFTTPHVLPAGCHVPMSFETAPPRSALQAAQAEG
jgi:hypothetical protein